MRVVRPAALCVALLLLAACSQKGEDTALPAVQGTATTTVEEVTADTPLALASALTRMVDGELALELAFNQRLAATQEFDALVHLEDADGRSVPGGWVLDDEGAILRFPSVIANRDYRVRIDAGLTAAAGTSLAAPISQDVHSGPLPPSASFASRGSVLPAQGTRGLPVIAVNVAQVDVEFYRVKTARLADFFQAYPRNGIRDSWDLDPRWGWSYRDGAPLTEVADSVYSHRFTLECKPNDRCLNHLPIQDIKELAEPGAYFAVMRRAGSLQDSYATSVFYVSDIGLHARIYRDRILVHAASLASGRPLGGVQLAIRDRKGRERIGARTDDAGNALLGYAFDPADVLEATLGPDVSLLPFSAPALDLSAFDVSGRRQADFDVFAWSGRDLYRPGETLLLSALLRDHDGRELAPQPLFATLLQPDGRAFVSTRLEPGELGYHEWRQAIPEDAATGKWQVEFRLDPASKTAVDSFSFHVEEFLPERLKLELSSTRDILAPGEDLELQVQGDYLYGAPAAGNRVTARLSLAVDRHPVAALKDYWFGDPTVALPREAREVVDERLDEHGHLVAAISPFEDAAPATPVALLVNGSVYETGGRAVNRNLKRVVWPADRLVGVRPLFNLADGADGESRAGFELVRSDAAGKFVGARDLKVTLLRELRRYHWVWSDDGGWQNEWSHQFEELETRTLNIEPERILSIDFPVEYGPYRLEVTDPETGLVTRFPFHAGWNWEDDNRGSEARPDKVKLALDKSGYAVGDTLRVTITPPDAGQGMLLVEADRLLDVRAIDARPGTTVDLPVTEDWMRHDVYITALVFRGGTARAQSTPARAVGEVHVPIERRTRRLDLAVEAPEQMRPGEDLQVKVSAPQLAGKTASVTISAVDVGVLNITRFKLPDPFAWFFSQRALGIDARDLYGRIIEAFEGGTARLAYGGDMALEALPQARRPTAEHKTVDLFSGAVSFDATGTAVAAMPMPEFNGTVRVSAVAFSTDSYGSAERETLVRAPIVLEASTPRVLAPGDRSELTVDVTNFTGAAAEISLVATSDGGLELGRTRQAVRLGDGERTTVNLPITARQRIGATRIDIDATGGEAAVHTARNLVVRPAWAAVSRSRTEVLDTPAPTSFPATLASGLIPDTIRARMTLTSLPPLPLAAAFKALEDYRYRCLEQTISVGYGALSLTPALAESLRIDAPDPDARRAAVNAELGRLAALQLPGGHFSMWGSNGYPATFLTPYAVEFMLDARDAGFAVNDQVLQAALQRLQDDLLRGGDPHYGSEHADYLNFAGMAHAGYVLARVGRAPLGTLRTLFDGNVATLQGSAGRKGGSAVERKQALGALPLVHLGIALKLMGDAPRAERALETAFALDFERPRWLPDYGSELRDTALMITLVHQHDLARPAWDARLVDLARKQASRQHAAAHRDWDVWYTTQEHATLARLAGQLLAGRENLVQGNWRLGGESLEIAPDVLWSRLFEAADLARGLRIEPAGEGPVYVISDVAGVPVSAPVLDESMVKVERAYFGMDGKPWDGSRPLVEGTALIVRVRMQAREAMPDAMLTELLPGGLEVENLNLADSSQWADIVIDGIRVSDRGRAADVSHEEFRDDRYVAVLDLPKGRKAQLFYLVRAVSPGRFVVPPPQAADMYRPELRGTGRSPVSQIEVTPP